MARYLKNMPGMAVKKSKKSDEATPQSEPIAGSDQVANSAGCYSFAVNDWARLDRFLILGSEGGSYYATERALTKENANAALRCIETDGRRAVARVVEISDGGRAPKNDPAIFALALAAAYGNDETRRAAFDALPRVCRIGTHLFHFAQYVGGMRGWGRGLKSAVANWYQSLPTEKLAFQAVKYQQRDGWSHRDLLRLSHPKPADDTQAALFYWMTQGWPGVGVEPHDNADLQILWAFERAKRAENAGEMARLIRDYRLPREAVPTHFLNDRAVWQALLETDMPVGALIRNLATLTRVGVFENGDMLNLVADKIVDEKRLKGARVHPIALLSALRTYAQGHGERGQNTWTPVRRIVDALDSAFYKAFRAIEPTGKRWVLALDVSGSMEGGQIAGTPGLTPRVASAAMSLVTTATETNVRTVAFTSKMSGKNQWSGETELHELAISPKQRLDDVLKTVGGLPFGGTDCALPMLWALERKIEADVFVVYTDSETWAGNIHPTEALKRYRKEMGIAARLIVVGMVSNGFTIADSSDSGMMDVVGFDTATPALMADFVR